MALKEFNSANKTAHGKKICCEQQNETKQNKNLWI